MGGNGGHPRGGKLPKVGLSVNKATGSHIIPSMNHRNGSFSGTRHSVSNSKAKTMQGGVIACLRCYWGHSSKESNGARELRRAWRGSQALNRDQVSGLGHGESRYPRPQFVNTERCRRGVVGGKIFLWGREAAKSRHSEVAEKRGDQLPVVWKGR